MNTNDKKIVYVTREIERALGVEPSTNYQIIANKTAYGLEIQKQYPDFVHLIEYSGNELLGTTELLAHPEVMKLISPDAYILVFKNTQRVESQISANHWKVLNPKSFLSEKVENKLTQIRWLGDLEKYLPTHTVKLTKYITWRNEPIVIQWAHGHTGDGTILLKSQEELVQIQEKFPERMARLSNYISGPSLTVNAVVTANKILMGNVSYQITGLAPFTDNQFSTVGNDWGLANRLLEANEIRQIQTIVRDIGAKLQRDGWLGLFGADFIMDENNRKIYLIEINARQPASATYESFLEEKKRQDGVRGITTFEAHIRALLGLPIDQDIIEITDGAQVVQRITKGVNSIFDEACLSLREKGFNVVAYENTKPNEDLLRIQSPRSIMESHNSLSPDGQKIVEIIKTCKLNLEI